MTDLLGRSGIVGLQFVPLLGLRARFARSHAFYDANVPSNNDIASLIFTSGALIKPKRFLLTQSSFWHDNVRGSTEVLNKLSQSDHYLVTPLFKPFDFLSNIVLPIRNGARISFARSSSTVKEDAAALHPTVVMADPHFAERIIDGLDARLERHLLSRLLMKCGLGWIVGRQVTRFMGGRLRYVIVDDAPCSVRVQETFKRLGIGLVEP